jgi:hypothetical protein
MKKISCISLPERTLQDGSWSEKPDVPKIWRLRQICRSSLTEENVKAMRAKR